MRWDLTHPLLPSAAVALLWPLQLRNKFTLDHATVVAHVAKYGDKKLPHIMSKFVPVRVLVLVGWWRRWLAGNLW